MARSANNYSLVTTNKSIVNKQIDHLKIIYVSKNKFHTMNLLNLVLKTILRIKITIYHWRN